MFLILRPFFGMSVVQHFIFISFNKIIYFVEYRNIEGGRGSYTILVLFKIKHPGTKSSQRTKFRSGKFLLLKELEEITKTVFLMEVTLTHIGKIPQICFFGNYCIRNVLKFKNKFAKYLLWEMLLERTVLRIKKVIVSNGNPYFNLYALHFLSVCIWQLSSSQVPNMIDV